LEELKSQVDAAAEDRRLQGAQREERLAGLRSDEALTTRMLEMILRVEQQLGAREVARG